MSAALEEAERLMTEDRFAEAADRFTAALRERPEDAGILRCRAMAYFFDAQFDKALADIDQAVTAAPDEVQNYLDRIFLRSSVDDSSDVLADIETALRLTPDSVEANCEMAHLQLNLANWNRAKKFITNALRADPNDDRARGLQATWLVWNGRPDEATKKARNRKKYRNKEKSYRLLFRLCYDFLNRQKPDRASKLADEGIRRFPKLPDFYVIRAEIRLSFGRRSMAEKDLDRAREILDAHPLLWSSNYHFQRVMLAEQRNRFDEALKELDLLLERTPSDVCWLTEKLWLQIDPLLNGKDADSELNLPSALETADLLCRLLPNYYYPHFVRYWLHFRSDRHTPSESDLERGLAVLTDHLDFRSGAATFLLESERYETVVQLLDRIDTEHLYAATALNQRGTAYVKLGHFRDAVNDLSLSMELAGLETQALADRGTALIELGKNALTNDRLHWAVEDFSRALEFEPENAEYFLKRGIARLRLAEKSWFGRKKPCRKALDDFSEAIRLKPDDHRALFYRAQAHRFLGNREATLDDIDEALRLAPDDELILCWRKKYFPETG